MSAPVLRPKAADLDLVQRRFVRGRVSPRGVVWLGFRSFWGHMRHLAASAIATEDIDSRDWMTPDAPEDLVARVAGILGGGAASPTSTADHLVGALGRDVWIDYVSDTGDDVSVSRAVARLVATDYDLPDPDGADAMVRAPRGDILLFGGDTAYPVATAHEITNRVLVPFNDELARRDDGRPRVLLGIPGNHDWYDGLDGFGRMFRRRDDDADARPSTVGVSRRMLEHYAEWTRELVLGGTVDKPALLTLQGYTPVQGASYFILPLSAEVHLVAVDRQLRTIDTRQRRFHRRWLQDHPEASPWVLMADPLFAFGEASPTGTEVVRSLELDFDARPHFLLAGDIHHYERLEDDRLLHVVAGGGGAFLHPAPLVRGRREAKVRWPGAAQSRALLWQVPLKIAAGRSGLIPHVVLGAIFAPAILVGMSVYERFGVLVSAPMATTLVVGIILTLIGGVRKRPAAVAALAFATAAIIASIPIAASAVVARALAVVQDRPPVWGIAALTYVAAVLLGATMVGVFLALLTRLGLEQTQAFTTLDHPGFKHFLRLRVRADGRRVDGWCIGVVDPLREGAEPVVVDHFTWRP